MILVQNTGQPAWNLPFQELPNTVLFPRVKVFGKNPSYINILNSLPKHQVLYWNIAITRKELFKIIGILLGFIRSFFNSSDIDERKKVRRIKNFVKNKSIDLLMDRRVFGIVSVLLIIGLPFYLGHRSENPVFFGMYSAKFMLVNTLYVIILLFSIGLFVYRGWGKSDN